tara:strand:+ start:368 stop:790 length:423 start_codon:yes stop_codon:yes gene_type:complete
MNKNNLLFCYPDTLFNKFLPQALQISIIKDFISKFGKEISFYTGENHFTYKKLGLFKKKLKTKPKIKGFVFFSFMQFCYDKKNNISTLENALTKKYEIYFAKEKLILKNINDFKKKKEDLFYYKKTNSEIINIILDSFST